MSRVTNLILAMGINDADRIPAINAALLEREQLTRLEKPCYAGGKALEVCLCVGAMNHFDLPAFAAHLRTVPFRDPLYVQLLVQGQDDVRFRILDVFGSPPERAPFDPPPLEAVGPVRRVLARLPELPHGGRRCEGILVDGEQGVGLAIEPPKSWTVDPVAPAVIRVHGALNAAGWETAIDVSDREPWARLLGHPVGGIDLVARDGITEQAVQLRAAWTNNRQLETLRIMIEAEPARLTMSEVRSVIEWSNW